MESIVFSSIDSPTIKIHPAITINDDYNSYKISYKIDKTKECHILTLKSTRFIGLYYTGVIHIAIISEAIISEAIISEAIISELTS